MTNSIASLCEDQFALVLSLDDNFFDKNKNRWYQLEALKCIRAWRANAGWLSKVKCYGFKSSSFTKLDKLLEKFDVSLLNFKDEELSCRNKLFKKILVQKLSASNDSIKEQFLINIDLDMNLQKEIPKTFFNCILGHVLVPKYSLDEAIQIERTIEKNIISNPTCSFFIAQDKNTRFFDDLYDVACSREFKIAFDEIGISQQYEEEVAYDFLIARHEKISKRKIAVGIDKDVLDQNYFDHQHMTNSEAIQILKQEKYDEF